MLDSNCWYHVKGTFSSTKLCQILYIGKQDCVCECIMVPDKIHIYLLTLASLHCAFFSLFFLAACFYSFFS